MGWPLSQAIGYGLVARGDGQQCDGIPDICPIRPFLRATHVPECGALSRAGRAGSTTLRASIAQPVASSPEVGHSGMALKYLTRQRPGPSRVTGELIEIAESGAAPSTTMGPGLPVVRRLNQIAAGGMVLLLVGGLLSLFASNFVPSHMTVQMAKSAALLGGLFYGLFFIGIGHFGWDETNPKVRAAMQQNPKLGKAYIRVPLTAAAFAGFAWLSFSNGLPWALNAAIGRRGAMTVIVDGWQNAFYSSRVGHSCARPTLRGIPFMMVGRYALCVGDQHKPSDFPPGTSLYLIGRVSALGIAPDHYRVPPGPGT